MIIAVIYALYHRVDGAVISLFSLSLLTIILGYLYRKGLYRLTGLILFLAVSGILTLNVSFGNAIFDEAMIAYPLIIVFSGLLFGKRSLIWVTAATIAQIGLVFFLAQVGVVKPFEGALPVRAEETITTCIILLTTGLILWVVINIIENTVNQIQKSENELEITYDLTLKAWAKALELRHREIPGHSQRVTSTAVELAKHLGYDPLQVKNIYHGALLHDVGKMGIPEQILLKPGRLNKREWEFVRAHPLLAAEILKDIPYLEGALEIVRYHHERYDGQGYPYQLKGEQIPEAAQLFSIIDSWDILSSDRPYSPALDQIEVIRFLKGESGKSFHPDLLDEFLGFLELKSFEGGKDEE
jgi:putative nucleotidyltransferase with HDIG domain